MLGTKENENNIIFFFIAKKVKRDSLFESRSILLSSNIKLLKSTKTIEKNIRKMRLLDGVIKSSVLIGTPINKNIDVLNIVKVCNTKTPGLDFLGILVNNEYISRTRIHNKDLLEKTLFWKTLITNTIQGLSRVTNAVLTTLSTTSFCLKNKKC